ncbi:MAG TPA: hypothetical protein VF995_01840 [Actinomycetota bacterium]
MTEDPFTGRLQSEPLVGLRALREALREEERQVSYWRRLVQGRLDLARTALAGGEPTAEFLAITAATRERPSETRARRSPAFTGSLRGRESPPVGDLGRLWETPMPWDDTEQLTAMTNALAEAETALSLYRRTLHQRIDACTAELVGRYRRDLKQLDRIVP